MAAVIGEAIETVEPAVQAKGLGHGRLEVGPDPVGLAPRLAVQGLARASPAAVGVAVERAACRTSLDKVSLQHVPATTQKLSL